RHQARIITTVGGHALVRARAGSGKTATMVARVAFLVRACGVDPRSILLLAFNRDAANELEDRLRPLLPGSARPHVMTFHALAYRMVHPEETLIYDASDSQPAQSSHIQKVVNAFIADPDGLLRIREVMLAH